MQEMHNFEKTKLLLENTAQTFSLNNTKQDSNLIDALKRTCRKFTKQKTGKRPLANINLIRI